MRRIWVVSLLYGCAFSALVCAFYPCLCSDTITRYAPMADAFARGEWELAFHPRFGVFFQCVAGLVASLGVRGDYACQITAVWMLALSAVPLWCLAKKLFGETVAWWSVVALFVCDDYTRYAMDGLRDVSKCLAFALMGWGVVSERSRWFALGLFILITGFSYGFVVGCALLFCWCVYFLIKREPKRLLAPCLAWILATVAVSMMVHATTGWWVPVPHFIKFVKAFT